ncbi:BrxA family protein [Synechococcus sp. CCY 0621]|uniref:BrxA family protein n=1 Tax=Synechococcus sp. CCY 0621 TaxID=2815603 RepID=UPI001C22C9DE|nr:BrxA family protein [Synechococcus sp. CCY 0621]
MIDDTLQMFQGWELEASKQVNLDQVRASNSIGASTQAWLKQVCSTFSRRFDPSGRDRALALAVLTATGRRHWKPLLLWHMAISEGLLGDGLSWAWTEFEAGGDLLQTPQALDWLEGQAGHGHPEVTDWSEATRKRVAGGLLKAGVDFGLLQGRVKRRFTAYYLADEPLLYVLLQALASNATTAAALADPRWLWFRLPETELEHRLLQLHQAKVISYYRAGSVVDLKLPASCAEALVQKVWT